MKTPSDTPWTTILADIDPIAEGIVRQIWDRPGHPDQILKTIQPRKVKKFTDRGPFRRFIDDLRLGPYRSFQIEYRYYSKTAYKAFKAGRPNPIAEMGGLIHTDRGLALICEKITDRSGGLAKTLKDLIAEKSLDHDHIKWLNDLIKTVFILNVSFPDVSRANIVFDERRSRFLVVDGYGDKARIPLRTWFRKINVAKIDARIAKKVALPGYLEWNSDRKEFSLV